MTKSYPWQPERMGLKSLGLEFKLGFPHRTGYSGAMFPGIKKGEPAVVLAPMEGVTDASMRAVLTKWHPFQYCVSEFIRVTDLVPPRRVFSRHVPEIETGGKTHFGTPVQIQLLGGDPAVLTDAAQYAIQIGFEAIDLNFGCPAPTVNRHDGGATLLKYPERIYKIIRTVRDCLPSRYPVSAKLRLGWENPRDILINAKKVEEAGASWMTLHARTRMQGYQPPVFWDIVGEVNRTSSIPVVANGDIRSFQDFTRCRELTGCEHFMVGRGALGNLELVSQMAKALGIKLLRDNPSISLSLKKDWDPLLKDYLEWMEKYEPINVNTAGRIKQWIKFASLSKNIPWFDEIKTKRTVSDILSALKAI